MRKSPLVSIITPSYNQGEFIEDTLRSVKNQDYSNIEHIVVDGDSTDETLEILKKYEDKYNLKWISEPDDGQSDAVNKGLEMAKGEIVGWLNSDDIYYYRSTLSHVVKKFQTSYNPDIVYGDTLFVNKNYIPLFIRKRKFWRYDFFLRGWTIPQPSVFFSKKVLSENKLNTELEYVMDLDYWLRIFKKYDFQYLERVLSVDRLHERCKRFNADSNIFKKEWEKILYKYGQEFSFKYHFLKQMDKLYFGLMRLLGGLEIFSLRGSNSTLKNPNFDKKHKTIEYLFTLLSNREKT